ncbi:MAG: hypothetical protein HZA94_03320 [Candidatus Vogelbacteria bacterium]|nr:hypothetical protein [Candidatus Vogelbacteria bacterium]
MEDTYFGGRDYCNKDEKRVGRLLAEAGILNEYSKEFPTVDRLGRHGKREVDFWLDQPRMLRGFPRPVQAIEVKSSDKINGRGRCQRRELLTAGVETFKVTPNIIELWEREGILEDFGLATKTIRGRRRKKKR